MNLEELNQWLLPGSHLGILARLILVTLQIRQDSTIAKTQPFRDITTSRMAMAGVMLGEAPAPIVAKSRLEPGARPESFRAGLGVGAMENIIQF